ncbi:MAG TPA: carboxypeptidase-like regulatory domain-containing protein [Candidatus Angelobacter sp.]|nr:carboxypeptidase-like regulatory domain-containing protein [Candidatus Angelobacter sp.]
MGIGRALSCLALLVSLAPGLCLGEERIDGQVLSSGQPIKQAVVRIQGRDTSVLSDEKGNFTLSLASHPAGSVYVSAGHEGFYNNRVLWKPGAPVIIDLTPLPDQDNSSYDWQEPKPNSAQADNCGNCHTEIFRQWSHDAHGEAASNPIMMTMYTGADAQGHPNQGPGYRRDWNDFGNCSTCHAPTAAFANEMMANMQQLEPKQQEGVLCDFCHKIQSVPEAGASPNVVDLHFLRPVSGKKLLFGPISDATFPEEVPDFSYSPLFKSSRLCASCHEGEFWGVPAYETFSEWAQSRYAKAGIQCQGCHMRPTGTMDHFTDVEKGGKIRNPATIAYHGMMGLDRDEFIRQAVDMKISTAVDNGLLTVKVSIANAAAGHKFPTGQPMRNAILTVEASDESGKPLRLVSGERVPIWGGSGKAANDYAGLPGKGFAKVLETLSEYQKVTIVSETQSLAEFPAPMWRKTRIKSDNRIAPDGEDESAYVFLVPAGVQKVQLVSRLVYRRAFKPLTDAKHWDLSDLLLSAKHLALAPGDGRVIESRSEPDNSKSCDPATVCAPSMSVSASVPAGRSSRR